MPLFICFEITFASFYNYARSFSIEIYFSTFDFQNWAEFGRNLTKRPDSDSYSVFLTVVLWFVLFKSVIVRIAMMAAVVTYESRDISVH